MWWGKEKKSNKKNASISLNLVATFWNISENKKRHSTSRSPVVDLLNRQAALAQGDVTDVPMAASEQIPNHERSKNRGSIEELHSTKIEHKSLIA